MIIVHNTGFDMGIGGTDIHMCALHSTFAGDN